jgi:hypothetical protein
MGFQLAAAVSALVCATSTAAAPRHVVETASATSTTAQLSYDYHPGAYAFSHPHVTITRAGTTLVDTPVRPLPYHGLTLQVDPAHYFEHAKSVFVRDLDGDGEPEVYLDLYWGGAHCCWYIQVYRYGPSGRYSLRTHVWGNPQARRADLDHDRLPEFVSGDDRFPYEFTDYADSTWPVQIYRYRAGAFANVTRRFPSAIAADAARQWRTAFAKQNAGRTKRGVLASWAADECALHRCAAAFRRLHRLALRGVLARHYACPCDRTATDYLRHLRGFLRRTGYLR